MDDAVTAHDRVVERERGAVLNELPGIPLVELNLAGEIVAANDGVCALLHRSRDELLGHSPLDFAHPDDRAVMLAEISNLSEIPSEGRQAEFRLMRGDGTVMWVHVTSVRLPEQEKVLDHVVDITDLATARDEARAMERRLRALIERSADIIAVLNREGALLDANPAGERMLGWKVSDKQGSNMLDVVHPDDLPKVTQALTETYSRPGRHRPVTFRIGTADGSWIYLDSIADNQLDDPAIAGVLINAHDVTESFEHLAQIQDTLESLVNALARASEYRDPYTAGHQQQVAALARAIAQQLQLPEDDIKGIEIGATLHDIGKIAVPAEILTRPGRLTPLEYEMAKTHSLVGDDILSGITFPWPVPDIVRHHHERLDGSGYPDGLKGDAISLAVRIVMVADVIDAMSSHRPYRPALGLKAARQELQEQAGVRYDPTVVEAALAAIQASGPGSSEHESPVT